MKIIVASGCPPGRLNPIRGHVPPADDRHHRQPFPPNGPKDSADAWIYLNLVDNRPEPRIPTNISRKAEILRAACVHIRLSAAPFVWFAVLLEACSCAGCADFEEIWSVWRIPQDLHGTVVVL